MENTIMEDKAALTPVKRDFLLMLFALLSGVTFDYLFYGKVAGVSFPAAVFLFYVLFFWRMRDKIKFTYSFAWMLMLPIALLSFTYVLYSNSTFYILNGMAIPFLIAVQTLLVTRNHTYPWHSLRFIREVLQQILPRSLSYFPMPYRLLTTRIRTKINENQYKSLTKVLIGLLISLPILGIVVTLLASADKVFEEVMYKIPNLLEGLHIGELFFRFVLILFVATYAFSYIWSMLQPRRIHDELAQVRKDKPFSIDSIIALTILIVINLVYVLFTLVQFSYFFGSGEAVLPNGTSYAEHARSGFGELVIVTVINFSILLTVIHFVKKEGLFILRRIIQLMLSILIGCTSVILCSSYVRLVWYEQAYGYTYTRILVHAFLIFLFILFLLLCTEYGANIPRF